jgi:hypothetical protein
MRGKFREVNKEAQNWARKAIMRIIMKLDQVDEKTEKTERILAMLALFGCIIEMNLEKLAMNEMRQVYDAVDSFKRNVANAAPEHRILETVIDRLRFKDEQLARDFMDMHTSERGFGYMMDTIETFPLNDNVRIHAEGFEISKDCDEDDLIDYLVDVFEKATEKWRMNKLINQDDNLN